MYGHRQRNGFFQLLSSLGKVSLPVLAQFILRWLADFSEEIFGPLVSNWLGNQYTSYGFVAGSLFLVTCLIYSGVCLLQSDPHIQEDARVYFLFGIVSGLAVYLSRLQISSIPSERSLHLTALTVIYGAMLLIFKRLSTEAKRWGMFFLVLVTLAGLTLALTPAPIPTNDPPGDSSPLDTTTIATTTPVPTTAFTSTASLALSPSPPPLPPPRSTSRCLYTDQLVPRNTRYVVQPGDSISCIADRAGVSPQALITANRDQYPGLVTNPNLILIEWVLYIP